MASLSLPGNLDEDSLRDILRDISLAIDHPICFHLSKDRIDQRTRITYQLSQRPRRDGVVPRFIAACSDLRP